MGLDSTMSEILAPAGSENSALAAINAGADAIYLGLDRFSARSSAENFNMEEFVKILSYAHAMGVKVYAALNTVVKNSELKSFLDTCAEVWNAGADALIIQDVFLGKFIKARFPQIKLHLSTQAGTCNTYGARIAKEYGFDRVILARETHLKEICEISKIIETEAFIQGALCTCFSGQCYMSSFAGGNSGNRGRCKQPCRKIYSIDRKGFEEPAYRLSLSDLCVGENIKELAEAGVTSFKIEGRMRRPEYVAAAVGYYKDKVSLSSLKRTYNRGNYTKGLAFGQDKSFISSAVQGHIGEFAGTIKVENSKYICHSVMKFCNGDGFKILRGGKEVGGGAFGGTVKGGFIVSTRARLKNGDKVFVTTDTSLNEKLLSDKRTITVKIKANFIAGKPAEAEIGGHKFYGVQPLDYAKSRPLTKEEIIRCFEKVDGYPFSPDCEAETDGVFITASAMNAFRRKVYAEYFELISENKNVRIEIDFEIPETVPAENKKTAVISTDLNGIQADIGILKLKDFSSDFRVFKKNFNGEKYLFVPPFLTDAEIESISEAAIEFDGIYCDSYFGLKLAEKLSKNFFAGTGFNITNSVSFGECGAKYICVSKELTLSEAERISAPNAFYLTEGNIKVMDLIYCPFEKKCEGCDGREIYELTDGDGRKFPLRRYKTSECRFEVYNCADITVNSCKIGKLKDVTLGKENKEKTRGHSVLGVN